MCDQFEANKGVVTTIIQRWLPECRTCLQLNEDTKNHIIYPKILNWN